MDHACAASRIGLKVKPPMDSPQAHAHLSSRSLSQPREKKQA